MLGVLKLRNKPNTKQKDGIVVKVADVKEKTGIDTKENEVSDAAEPRKPKIVDYSNVAKLNRAKILQALRDEPLSPEAEEAVVMDVEPISPRFKDLEPTEKQEKQEKPEPTEKAAPPKKRVRPVIHRDKHIQIAPPIQAARINTIVDLQKRVPKPVNYDKVIMRAPTYYMNNRKLYLQKINQFFAKYKRELGEIEESEITCDSRSRMENLELFIHQRVVRDYLNIYTPYRGLLLYHGLGSGKTCTSIAIAEGMKSHKGIVVMTPASLKMNFFAELKKCGDQLYKKEQFWEFVSTEGKPDLTEKLAEPLGLSESYIQKHKGAWFVDIRKPSNFGTLEPVAQQQIDDQLNAMIRSKYTDINYNGLNWGIVNRLTEDQTVNPFDNKVVIIDEAHNFVSRIVNKIKSPKSISFLLYNYLMSAENAKIVLLTGTPIINYPNEIGVLFNMLRGFIKTWSMQLRVNTTEKVNRDFLLDLFEKEGLHIFDYVEYSGNTLTITRNPYGFVNTVSTRNKVAHKKTMKGGLMGGSNKRKTKKAPRIHHGKPKIKIHSDVIHLDHDPMAPDDAELTEEEREEAEETIDQYKEREREQESDLHGGSSLQRQNTSFATTATTLYAMPSIFGGDSTSHYNGVKLDDTGNLSDEVFLRRVVDILKKHDIEVIAPSVQLTLNKALPDNSEEFLSTFVESNEINRARLPAFKRRILGLTSYFRSAQESLLPQYIPTESGDTYHVVPCVMSDYQYGEYARIRKEEADREKSQRVRKKMQKADELFNTASSYRIFSRACCNFAFPKPPGRPLPSNKTDKEVNEREFDALPSVGGEDEGATLEGEPQEENEGVPEEAESTEYLARIQQALLALQASDKNYLTAEGLAIYSPKFLEVLDHLENPEHAGLHLLYSNFRTIEGIGILRLILEANGFVEFKLERTSAGIWDITESSLSNAYEEEPVKPRFVLYTGTETAEEKEIIRNIYNSDWRLVPKNIVEKLEATAKNNFLGEVIKIMMITAAGAEGINLKNTRYVHIVEPYWHMVRLEQVIGRARRICSHADLPAELRTIQVFLYISTFSEAQKKDDKNIELRLRDVSKLDQKTPITTDESLYEISILKDKIIRELLTSVKETAIDCSVYASSHEKERLVCYGFGKVESNQFASYPILEQDLGEKEDVQKKTAKVQKIKIGEKVYMQNVKTNELYDPEEYERTKRTGADLVPIGRLVKGPDGGFQIVTDEAVIETEAPKPKEAAPKPKEAAPKPKEAAPKPKEAAPKPNEAPVPTKESLEAMATDIVFVFSDKSTDKPLPGKGPGEKIPKSKMADFKELTEIPDWRKKLDSSWPAEFEMSGKRWASVEHYVQAAKYKKTAPELYEEFALDSDSELSKDAEMAKSVGETGKAKGKIYKVAGKTKFQPELDVVPEATEKAQRAKYATHADLRELLRKTRPAQLYRNLRGKDPELQESLMRVRGK